MPVSVILVWVKYKSQNSKFFGLLYNLQLFEAPLSELYLETSGTSTMVLFCKGLKFKVKIRD